MKFSIIIPAYNAYGHILRALNSIVEQSFDDHELIVVADACEDDTAKLAECYGAKVIETDYHNVGLARNAGLEAASGEYILFMDDDDWFLHEFVLEQLVAELGNYDIVCFGFLMRGVGYCPPVRIIERYKYYWPAPWTKCYKRTAIGGTRFADTFPEDVPFTNKMLNKGLRIHEFNMPLYYYNYMRPGSVTAEKVAKGIEPDLRRIKC